MSTGIGATTETAATTDTESGKGLNARLQRIAVNLTSILSALGGGNAGMAKQLTPTVGTAAYVAGDCIGGILEFTTVNSSSGRPVRIDSIAMVDKSQQSIPLTFLWFKATPSGGTYTDGSQLVFGSGDYANYVGATRFAETEWASYPATPTDDITSKNGLDTVLPVTGTSLFALCIADVLVSTTLTNGDIIINIAGAQL